MWNVDPSRMCRRHLLGEHVECHMFVGVLNKGISVTGYLNNGLLEIHNLRKRHDELVVEMLKRGYSHNKKLPEFKEKVMGSIDTNINAAELKKRCKECTF